MRQSRMTVQEVAFLRSFLRGVESETHRAAAEMATDALGFEVSKQDVENHRRAMRASA